MGFPSPQAVARGSRITAQAAFAAASLKLAAGTTAALTYFNQNPNEKHTSH
jgi:hypothetical protein